MLPSADACASPTFGDDGDRLPAVSGGPTTEAGERTANGSLDSQDSDARQRHHT
jgi:hypothetical protein